MGKERQNAQWSEVKVAQLCPTLCDPRMPRAPLNPSRTLWGCWVQKLVVSPNSQLQEIGFIQPPGSSLSSNEQVETGANMGREGMQRQGRSSQETITQPWDRAWVPSRDTRSNTFELLCRCWNPHRVGEVNCCPQAQPRPVGTRSLMMLTLTYLTTHQSEDCPWTDHTVFEPWLQHSSLPAPGWDTQFWGR